MKSIQYQTIGTIRSPFTTPDDTPIQPGYAREIRGRIELLPEYRSALTDLESFSHIFLIYDFHLSDMYSMKVQPVHEVSFHGVFATRSANRPNPIGLSVVRLESVDGSVLYVSGIDVVDGTPLLDIKPYIPSVDRPHGATLGWLADKFRAE